MRISKAQAESNRTQVVEAASRLFRERGFDGVAVGELMKAAGFTHGGFYNHFPSKEVLAAEALEAAFLEMDDQRSKASGLEELVAGYLSDAARRAPGRACPTAALGGDAARQPEPVKQVFESGLERIISSLEARLPEGPDRRARAISLFAGMAGAVILARALPDESPLADEVLAAERAAALSAAQP